MREGEVSDLYTGDEQRGIGAREDAASADQRNKRPFGTRGEERVGSRAERGRIGTGGSETRWERADCRRAGRAVDLLVCSILERADRLFERCCVGGDGRGGRQVAPSRGLRPLALDLARRHVACCFATVATGTDPPSRPVRWPYAARSYLAVRDSHPPGRETRAASARRRRRCGARGGLASGARL